MLRNLDLDHTGFREALLVDGPASVAPLIQVSCPMAALVNVAGRKCCRGSPAWRS